MSGRFAAATITAVMTPKSDDVDVDFVYNFLLTHKDEVLVSLMRGATNVTLNIDRLKQLVIPYPPESTRRQAVRKVRACEERIQSLRADTAQALIELDRAREEFIGLF